MAFMAAIAPILSVVGTIVSTVGAIQAGNQQKQAADYAAASQRQAAMAAEASGSARSAEKIREMGIMASSSQANAAASGVNPGVGSPLTNLGRINKYGRYNALMEIYNGKVQGTGFENQARADEFAGSNAQTAGYWNAGSTLLSGADTLYSRYGGGSSSGALYPNGRYNALGRTAALGAQGYA